MTVEPFHEPFHPLEPLDMPTTSHIARDRRQAGFTLIEMLVVLAILALISAFAAPQVIKHLGRSRTEAAKIQVQRLSASLDLFQMEVNRYPSQQEGLAALVRAPADTAGWNGPYLRTKDSLTDPWGRQYLYRSPGRHGPYDLYTLGADGAEGGDGDAQDIANW